MNPNALFLCFSPLLETGLQNNKSFTAPGYRLGSRGEQSEVRNAKIPAAFFGVLPKLCSPETDLIKKKEEKFCFSLLFKDDVPLKGSLNFL